MRAAYALAASLALVSAAEATTRLPRSLYTALDTRACTKEKGEGGEGYVRCPGLGGVSVLYRFADSHSDIGFAIKDAGIQAGPHTLQAKNTVFPPGRRRPTIEWRVARPDGKPIPYAAIVRYFTAGPEGRGEVLVVSRVSVAGSCHIAYIDALANADAIVLAREIADRRARTYDCANPPAIEGQRGKSPM